MDFRDASKKARGWFVIWLKITLVGNMILGIFPCLRDKRFTKKEKEDPSREEFSTLKRIYLAIFYSLLILCACLTINALTSYGNTSCEISLICSSACKNVKEYLGVPHENDMCRPKTVNGPFLYNGFSKDPIFDKFSMNILRYNFTDTPAFQDVYLFCMKSYVCMPACRSELLVDPRPLCINQTYTDLYCVDPNVACGVNAHLIVSSADSGSVVFAKLFWYMFTSILILIGLTPFKVFLKVFFMGWCKPRKATKEYGYYNIVTIVVAVLGALFVLDWFILAMVFINYDWTGARSASTKGLIVLCTFITWALTITVVDFVLDGMLACINFKHIFTDTELEFYTTPPPPLIEPVAPRVEQKPSGPLEVDEWKSEVDPRTGKIPYNVARPEKTETQRLERTITLNLNYPSMMQVEVGGDGKVIDLN